MTQTATDLLVMQLHANGLPDTARAIQALIDERDALREQIGQAQTAHTKEVWDLANERDRLRAQLGNMTTETRAVKLKLNPKGKIKVGPLRWQSRLVGPWVEATD